MNREAIGIAAKNPEEAFWEEAGVSFEVPYGDDKYGIRLSNQELDGLLDTGIEESLGRRSLIDSSRMIELESPDLPLFAHASSINLETRPKRSPNISMTVGIMTMSFVYEHRGLLFVRRECRLDERIWEQDRYEIQPPLQDIEAAVAAHVA